MSADNYYVIRKHPHGGFCALMGFRSDDSEPTPNGSEKRFATVGEAVDYANLEPIIEYGISIHDECRQQLDGADEVRARVRLALATHTRRDDWGIECISVDQIEIALGGQQ